MANRLEGNTYINGTLTANVNQPSATTVGYTELKTQLRLGRQELPLVGWREISAADIPNTAANGGLLASDTTPILQRTNVGTDPSLRIAWAAGNVDPITFSVMSPQDLKASATPYVYLRAKMAGSTDTPVIAVDVREDTGGSNLGGNTGALSSSLASVSKSFTPTATAASPKQWTITLTPGTHGTDAIYLHAAWLEYDRDG